MVETELFTSSDLDLLGDPVEPASSVEAVTMSMSVDIPVKKTSPWHYVTGIVVLTVAYVGLLLLIAWLKS